MKPKDALEQIESTLEVMKTRDMATTHKLATTLFRPADALAVIDQPLSDGIKARLTEILSSAELVTIMSKIEEIKQILEQLKVKSIAPTPQKRYLGVSQKQYLPTYLKAMEKYKAYAKALEKLETDILEASEYDKKLHEPIKYGKWSGYLHARLTSNLRVMYRIDAMTKVLIFEDIITKNEFEKS